MASAPVKSWSILQVLDPPNVTPCSHFTSRSSAIQQNLTASRSPASRPDTAVTSSPLSLLCPRGNSLLSAKQPRRACSDWRLCSESSRESRTSGRGPRPRAIWPVHLPPLCPPCVSSLVRGRRSPSGRRLFCCPEPAAPHPRLLASLFSVTPSLAT